jgi:hypothetical protein
MARVLQYIHGPLEFHDTQIRPLQHHGNLYIMDLALASNLTSIKLGNVNIYCLH